MVELGILSLGDLSRQGAIMIGSADEITGKLLEAVKTLSLDRIFAQVDWGGLPAAWSRTRSAATPPRSRPLCAPPDVQSGLQGWL